MGALLSFMALNAFAGGWYGISGAPAVPKAWLAGSPFRDYFIPGLFLFCAVGGTFAVAAALTWLRHRLARRAALAAGLLVIVWIGIQVSIIGYVSWMQPATASAGALIAALAAWPARA